MKKKLPQFHVEMCHPEDKYRIEPVFDKIKTLEGVHASFPYGGSSGEWGSAHARWTEQYGTPIGADITYYVDYEDSFYRLDVDFPVETIKDLTKRFYADREDMNNDTELQEYVYKRKDDQYDVYAEFDEIIFGFAPKGMVVVWFRYGATQKELGRYQAKIIKEDKELERKLFASWSMNRQEVRKKFLNPNASPEKWDNYRIKYVWKPSISSENPKFKLFDVLTEYFNAEFENAVRPISLHPATRERAIPHLITFFWETGKGEKFERRAFFDWQKTNEKFKIENNGDNLIQIKIAQNNNDFEVFINEKPLELSNKRIFRSEWGFKKSYK